MQPVRPVSAAKWTLTASANDVTAGVTSMADATNPVAALHDMLHTDQTGLAAGLEAVLKTVAGYRWITVSRGSYEWDDEQYRQEMGYMLDAVHKCAEEALRRWKAGSLPRPCCALAVDTVDWRYCYETNEKTIARLHALLKKAQRY